MKILGSNLDAESDSENTRVCDEKAIILTDRTQSVLSNNKNEETSQYSKYCNSFVDISRHKINDVKLDHSRKQSSDAFARRPYEYQSPSHYDVTKSSCHGSINQHAE